MGMRVHAPVHTCLDSCLATHRCPFASELAVLLYMYIQAFTNTYLSAYMLMFSGMHVCLLVCVCFQSFLHPVQSNH